VAENRPSAPRDRPPIACAIDIGCYEDSAMQHSSDGHSSIWEVLLPTGETRKLSLDALDRAYQAGEIDERTLVLREGETSWRALGDLAGLDADAASSTSSTSSTPPPVEASPQSIVPVALDPASSFDLRESVDRSPADDLGWAPPQPGLGRAARWGRALGILAGLSVVGFLAFAGVYARASIREAVTGTRASTPVAAAATSTPVAAVATSTPVAAAPAPAPSPSLSPAPSPAVPAAAPARVQAKADAGVPEISASALPSVPSVGASKTRRAKHR